MSFTLVFAAGTKEEAAEAAGGSLNAYTTLEEPLAAALFEMFEKETGIHVNFVRLAGGEAVARLEAESANPQVSIWVGGVGLDHITAKTKGLTTPYFSRYAENTPQQYRDPEGYWFGLYVGPLTFVTNLDRAKALGITPPKSWADLLKPEYKGLIRMASPNSSGTAYNVLTTVRYINNGNEDKMMEYLIALDKNIDQYTLSGSAPGKTSRSVRFNRHRLCSRPGQAQSRRANIEINAPSEGTGYELASRSLVKGGKEAVNAKNGMTGSFPPPMLRRNLPNGMSFLSPRAHRSTPMHFRSTRSRR